MKNLVDIYTDSQNNLLQSEAWQAFHQSLGHKTWQVDCDEGKTLVIKIPLYQGRSYLYVPRGPHCTIEGWHVLLRKTIEIAKTEKCVFMRVEPLTVPNGTLKKLNFKPINKYAPLSRQFSPNDTLILDLRLSEDEILAGMKPKGRYNIKVAERKGVKIRQSQKENDLKVFFDLSLGMKDRGYTAFGFSHYEKLLEALKKDQNVSLFVAEHEGEILSVILVTFFGASATYLHGASSDNKRELMPNNLAQWEAIKEAKKRNCQVYDFWGIAPDDNPEHPWAGITRFKKNFGGEPIHLLGAFDFTFQPTWYRIFSLINRLRKGLSKE